MLSLMAGHSSDFLPQPCAAVMESDFEVIIEELKMEFPLLHVEQVNEKHPADNDGLWFLSVPGKPRYVDLESAHAVDTFPCPFMIESIEQCCENALRASTVADASRLIADHLREIPVGHPVILDGENFVTIKRRRECASA